jgi:hypothetical protein
MTENIVDDRMTPEQHDELWRSLQKGNWLRRYLSPSFPIIVTLCGSTRFKKEYEEAMRRETLAGNICIGVGTFGHIHRQRVTVDGCMGQDVVEVDVVRDALCVSDDQKRMLDELHLRKIDLSDQIYVLNVGGYIGESTKREIAYAKSKGKEIRYLELVQEPSRIV